MHEISHAYCYVWLHALCAVLQPPRESRGKSLCVGALPGGDQVGYSAGISSVAGCCARCTQGHADKICPPLCELGEVLHVGEPCNHLCSAPGGVLVGCTVLRWWGRRERGDVHSAPSTAF